MSMDLFDLWHIARARHMGRNNWDFVTPRETQLGNNGTLRGFREVVAWNIDCSRRAQISPFQ